MDFNYFSGRIRISAGRGSWIGALGGQERAKEGQTRANQDQKLAKIYKAKNYINLEPLYIGVTIATWRVLIKSVGTISERRPQCNS